MYIDINKWHTHKLYKHKHLSNLTGLLIFIIIKYEIYILHGVATLLLIAHHYELNQTSDLSEK